METTLPALTNQKLCNHFPMHSTFNICSAAAAWVIIISYDFLASSQTVKYLRHAAFNKNAWLNTRSSASLLAGIIKSNQLEKHAINDLISLDKSVYVSFLLQCVFVWESMQECGEK